MRKGMLLALVLAIVVVSGEYGMAQAAYPERAVQIFVGYAAGGATDASARIIAQFLQDKLGVPVVVVNQTGAGGMVACETVRTAKPDGYTLLYEHFNINSRPVIGLYPHTYKEFASISTGSVVNQTMLCRPAAPWNSLTDFVGDAKKSSGKYSFWIQTGASSHFHAAALIAETGIEIRLLEAGGEMEKLAALMGGRLDVIQATVGAAREYVAAGKAKLLAVSAPERDPLAPDFPTAREQGFDIVIQSQHYLLGPQGLPSEVGEALSNALAKFGGDPENIQKLNKIGQNWVYLSPEDTTALLEEEYRRLEKLAEKIGLKK